MPHNMIGFFAGVDYDEPGSWERTTPQTTTFIVPNYQTSLTATVRGGGGGGGGGGTNSGGSGGTGGQSRFEATDAGYGSDLVANGGQGGEGNQGGKHGGSGGSASGGSTNTTGGTGDNGGAGPGGDGGDGGGPDGGAGGNGGTNGGDGTAPGGGGGGSYAGTGSGGGGGGGGYCTRTFGPGDLTPGSVVTVVVGNRGSRGNGFRDGGLGSYGRVTISWT